MAAPIIVEMLRFPVEAQRARATLDALRAAATRSGVALAVTTTYRGAAPWLVLWGPGAPDRVDPMRRQLASGGHVIALDLAYWHRERKFRVSIDGAHPQAWIMRREWPNSRWRREPVPITQAWNPRGPVVIAGIGEKATVQYGAIVREWEAEMVATARAHGFIVHYRPKKSGPCLSGTIPAPAGAIETALRGASRVITWHSNVAIDAIRLGIPVMCRDGAAAAVCPSAWRDDAQPLDRDLRDRFLANLAWFQWDVREAAGCWAWLREVLS